MLIVTNTPDLLIVQIAIKLVPHSKMQLQDSHTVLQHHKFSAQLKITNKSNAHSLVSARMESKEILAAGRDTRLLLVSKTYSNCQLILDYQVPIIQPKQWPISKHSSQITLISSWQPLNSLTFSLQWQTLYPTIATMLTTTHHLVPHQPSKLMEWSVFSTQLLSSMIFILLKLLVVKLILITFTTELMINKIWITIFAITPGLKQASSQPLLFMLNSMVDYHLYPPQQQIQLPPNWQVDHGNTAIRAAFLCLDSQTPAPLLE